MTWEDLATSNFMMVERIVGGMVARGQVPRWLADESAGYGMIGLVEAARRFEVSLNVPFTAFAAKKIKFAVMDGLRQLDHLSRKHCLEVKADEAEEPSFCTVESALVNDDPALAFEVDHSRRLESKEFWEAVSNLLPERNAEIVRLYFLEQKKLKEIGSVYGLSETRICEIIRKSIESLREQEWLVELN